MDGKDAFLSPIEPLTEQTLAQGVAFLGAVDADLARVHATYGMPPMWAREPGFPTLVHLILEQQVSLASARAAFVKLGEAIQPVTPEKFMLLDDQELKTIGFSRQKTGYCRGLARAILDHEIELDTLSGLDDTAVRSRLIKIKGIGLWTADVYLLMVLRRPDIWPSGDLALASAMQQLKGLSSRPDQQEMERIAIPWQPWRAVAARLLWHFYLSQKNHVPNDSSLVVGVEKSSTHHKE